MEVLFTTTVHDWGTIKKGSLLPVLTMRARGKVIVYYMWVAKAPLLTMPAQRQNGIKAPVIPCSPDTAALAVPSQISGIAKAAFTNPCSRHQRKFKKTSLKYINN